MATEKTLNTRIKLRYDLYSNWSTNNPKLLAGEVALAYIPTGENNSVTIGGGAVNGTTPPQVLIKVGDGEHNYNDLKYVSALAADVLSYCKSETALTAFVNNLINDAGLADNEAFTALAGRVTTAEGEITTLKGDEKTAGSVAKAIKDAIDALDLADTYEAKGEAAKVQTALNEYMNTNGGIVNDIINGRTPVAKATGDGDGNEIKTTYATKSALEGVAELAGANSEAITAIKNGKEINDFAGVESELESLSQATESNAQSIDGINDTLGDFSDAGENATVRSYIDTQVADAKKAGTDAQADVDALEGNVGSVDGLSTTNKTVVGAINEVLAAVGTGGTAAVVTIEKSTDGLTYTIKQGSATVGTIDIPKDMVVTAGEVVTNPEGQAEGTYIKLTLANVTDPLYINVGTLVDIYKPKAGATQVQIAIDSATREISATIVAGSIGTTELATDAVTTAKIADANVTFGKLSTEVQGSLNKADSALQPENIADLISDKHNHANKTVLDGISADAVNAWNSAEQNAKDYADDQIEALALGTMSKETATDYVKKSEATGYDDILTKTEAQGAYQPKGEYATAEQGGKADTAVQTISTPADADGEPNGLKAVKTGTDVAITIDDSIVWVFDCGNSGVTA